MEHTAEACDIGIRKPFGALCLEKDLDVVGLHIDDMPFPEPGLQAVEDMPVVLLGGGCDIGFVVFVPHLAPLREGVIV